jgi:hypothetical protein
MIKMQLDKRMMMRGIIIEAAQMNPNPKHMTLFSKSGVFNKWYGVVLFYRLCTHMGSSMFHLASKSTNTHTST